MTSISSINPFAGMVSNSSSTGIESAMGRDAFLRMLMVQLQNQDPMDPTDSQQFSSQLAQFSQLEELQGMRDSLDSSLSTDMLLTQSITNTLAASLIGKTVVANTASGYLHDGSADFHFHLDDAAENVKINIFDESGSQVKTITLSDLPEGDQTCTWNGTDSNGNSLPEGVYTFTVSATDSSGASVTASPFIEGKITGIRYENGMAVLLIGDIEINLSEVTEILDGESGSGGEENTPWIPFV
jgi:flagellar basal-body rod modification protein FlgD